MWTLKALAERFSLEFQGAPEIQITGIGTLANATKGQLAFLANSKYSAQLAGTAASVVVLSAEDAANCPCACLISANPYVSFAQITQLFDDDDSLVTGIHPTAMIAKDSIIHASARIAAFVSIGSGVVIEQGAQIHEHCHIGPDCHIGADCQLLPRVTLVKRVRLGKRVRIHSGAVLGADGFGLAMHQGQWLKVAQLGGVRIGDDCEIGANTTIDRGAIEDTELENDVRLDNQIQVGHNVRIGAHTAVAGCVAIAGSTRIGRYCLIGGAAGIVGHIEIADKITVGAMSLVTHSLREPGEYASGTPILAKDEWRKNAARFKQLDKLARQVNTLKKTQD